MNAEELYEAEVGKDALERQHSRSDHCPYCWAAPDAPHTSLCPNRPEDGEAAPPTQKEGLF